MLFNPVLFHREPLGQVLSDRELYNQERPQHRLPLESLTHQEQLFSDRATLRARCL